MSIIHETSFQELINVVTGKVSTKVKNIGKEDTDVNKFKSLTRSTNDLVLVFPVLCTTGISIDTASMISKAIEKNCVNLLQMYLASIQISSSMDLAGYISKFHNNISVSDKITVDDLINFGDNLTTKSINASADVRLTDRDVAQIFSEAMKNINTKEAKTSLNEHALSDFKCHKSVAGYETILEAPTPELEHRYLIDKYSANDIKKANELMPTKVVVSYNAIVRNCVIEKFRFNPTRTNCHTLDFTFFKFHVKCTAKT